MTKIFARLLLDYDGGSGAVPWELIEKSIEHKEDKWLDRNRLPVGAVWTDPGSMKIGDVLVWFEHFNNTRLLPESRFQFRTTLSAVHPSTIPTPQFTSYEPTKRREQDVWALLFDKTITTCQLAGGMLYPKESWGYGRFLTTGNYRNLGVTHPAEWNGLPVFESNRPLAVIQEDERAIIEAQVGELPEDISMLLNRLVSAINKHEAKFPASVSMCLHLIIITGFFVIPQLPQHFDALINCCIVT